MGIYQHITLQYQVLLMAKHCIVMLNVDKFLYPWKQTGVGELIPCSDDVCQMLKHFCGLKKKAFFSIWSKST